ncbi:hypothetical protein [Bacillus pinisoli]|uniref:hypothetical protein n=1 Tax=Bacillus pinisoli TaxID=2901866 RepID=UPI001FF2DFF0|nr:hypothetical protein [Bacillus pinisoli]
MQPFIINHLIADDDFLGEESVTADFTYNENHYSITFKKSDLELVNTWYFKEDQTIPANLSHTLIDAIRDEIKNQL